jgi:hypothetical protein
MLYVNNLSLSNLFNNLEKGWLLLNTLFLLFFCKLKSEKKKKIKNNPCIARVRCSHARHT